MVTTHQSRKSLLTTVKCLLVAALLCIIFIYADNANQLAALVSDSRVVELTTAVVQQEQKHSPHIFTSSSCVSFIQGSPIRAEGGKKKVIRQNNGKSFALKVYEKNDIVSKDIMGLGGWELDKVDAFNQYFIDYSEKHGVPLSDLTFVDIGANIGWFTLSMAALGVNVIAFEPMKENIDFIKESMCLPENLDSGLSNRITLFAHGLGVRDEKCIIYSHNINVGDGHVKCVQDESELNMPHDYSIRGYIPVHRLDDVVNTHGKNIVVVKMDTEGYEGNVLEGGNKFFLEGRIDVIATEFVPGWIKSKGGDPVKFMKKFSEAGYLAKRRNGKTYMSNTDEMTVMSNFGHGDITMHSSAFRSSKGSTL